MTIREKILVIEDEKSISHFISTVLNNNGYEAMQAQTGEEALSMISSHCPDLVILDLGLPDMDGLDILRSLRSWSSLPVVVVSARSHERDKVAALDLGADDYMTKPFLPRELVLRISAILKRTYRLEEQTECYRLGKREVDLSAGVVRLLDGSGRTISLTNKEYQLLKLFLENRGRILTFDVLSESVWGENYFDYENTLMVHIRKLREKIEEKPSEPEFLITVKGLGYRMNR